LLLKDRVNVHEFISYSSVDGKDFAFRLADALLVGPTPITTWLDKRSLMPSRDWDVQIAEAISTCHSFLFVMTPDSVEDVSVCKIEWTRALQYKKPIVPLSFYPKVTIPFRLANRQYIDFTADFDSVLAKLRSYLLWLRSPAGILQSMKDRLADAKRDLRRATIESERTRIEEEIKQLEHDISGQQIIVDDPGAAIHRIEQTIEQGLRQERREATPVTSTVGITLINPPPGVVPSYFQDRSVETRIIGQFLQNDALYLVAIVGRSGIGKTALACRFLKSLERGQVSDNGGSLGVDGIVYLSAVGSRRISLINILSDLSALLPIEAAKDIQVSLKDPKKSPEAKVHDLLSLLGTKHIVLLLDNFESLVDPATRQIFDKELDEGLRAFLNFPYHAVKIIITSRVIPQSLLLTQPGRQKIIELDEGLGSPFAENLLREMDEDGKIGLRDASPELLSKAREYTRGYPRALEALFAALSVDRDTSLEDIIGVAESQLPENVVEALVGEAFNRLDPLSQQVMQALATYHFPVTVTAVNYLLQPYGPGMDSADILKRLVNMYFVRREVGRYYLHPADRLYALRRIPRGSEADRSVVSDVPFTQFALLHHAAEYFKHIRKPREQWKTVEDLAPQLSEFDLRCTGEEYDTAAQVLDEIDLDYLLLWGYANDVRLMRERLANHITEDHLRINQAKSLGTLSAILGNLNDAIDYYHQMLSLVQVANDQHNEIYALNGLAGAYRRLARYTEAITYSQQALFVANQLGDMRSEGSIAATLGGIYWSLGRYQEALQYQQQALFMARQSHDQRGEGYALGGLGSTQLSLGHIDEALAHYQQALSIFRAIGHRQGEAYILESLGRAYFNAGKLEEALTSSMQSLTLHTDIHNRRGEGHSAFNIARIYRAKHELDAALEYAERARQSLVESRVPEGATAQALVNVVKAALTNDKIAEAQALLVCAKSPANTGDLKESVEFAHEAQFIAQAEKLTNVELEARELIEEYDRKITGS
jgi:tetratricopeptide (TPR) repeat protein